MALVKRLVKGSPLTFAEGDNNLTYLEGLGLYKATVTGSNTFTGSQYISGSIIPTDANLFNLGSLTKPWKEIYVSTGSINFVNNGTVVSTLSTNADGSQNFQNGINVTGSLRVSGSTYIEKGLVIGGTASSNPVNYPNALTINGNKAGTYGGAIFLSKGNASQWGIVSDNTDDLIISNNNSFSTRNIIIYDSAEKIEFTYSGSLADNSAEYHNIAFTGNAIVPYQTNHYDLGSETNYFRDLYISTGSIKFIDNGVVVSTLGVGTSGVVFTNDAIAVGDAQRGFGGSTLMNVEIGKRGPSTNTVDTTLNYENLVFGIDVMKYIITGSAIRNIGIGQGASSNITTGDDNINIGYRSGHHNRNGYSNVTIGTEAGLFSGTSQTPTNNTFIGDRSGQYIGEGSFNSAVGSSALAGNVFTRPSNIFTKNTAIGAFAGYNITGSSTNNIYIGANSGPSTNITETYKFYVGNGDADQQPYIYGSMANASRTLAINATLTISGSLVLPKQSEPTSPASGSIYFSSADAHFYGWNGSTWKQLDN
jgi:hypothetical protein